MKMLLIGILTGAVLYTLGDAANEQQQEQQTYCAMVAEGTWPDFKGTFEESCK